LAVTNPTAEQSRCKLVALYRVSTDKQGESGLGLEAQQASVERYRFLTGCDLIASYKEIETGTHDDIADRPQLMKAIAHAKRSNATLVIGKLDRLVRSTVVMAALKKSEVKFVACDLPNANEFTIDIHVAVAADEARKISTRTKDALQAYRDTKRVSKRIRERYPDGVPPSVVEATAGKLGASLPQCRNLTQEARERGAKAAGAVRRQKADRAYADLTERMHEMRNTGSTLQQIADQLNSEGQTTRRQKPWNHVQVKRVLERSGLRP
jgi:DNA invertase Pin-like site-specific DNA recombinase